MFIHFHVFHHEPGWNGMCIRCIRNAAAIQGAWEMLQAYKAYKLGGRVSELLYSPALYGIDLSAQNMPVPRARAAPLMAVVGNTLWLVGGSVEVSL